MDTVQLNTRQQTDRDNPSRYLRITTSSIDDDRQDSGVGGTSNHMCQEAKLEGWRSFYDGLAPSVVGTAASQGVYYYLYQIFRNKAEDSARSRQKAGFGDGTVGIFKSLSVAALSGCLNVLLTNPIWVVVTRMQTHKKKESTHPIHGLPLVLEEVNNSSACDEAIPYGTRNAVQELYGEAGFLGFWKGVVPTLIMVSNPSIQFMLYETLLKKIKKRRELGRVGTDGITALEIFIFGAIAKLGATAVTYPLLVVKTRLQAKQIEGVDKKHRYKGTLDAIAKMIHYEGLAAFYKGMGTKIAQSVLAAAVLFMVKEELVKGARLLVTGKPKPR